MEFLRQDTMKFEKAVTTITERPITKAPLSWTVTARAEQIPRMRVVIGLPMKIGLRRVSFNLSFITVPPHYLAVASESAALQQSESAGASRFSKRSPMRRPFGWIALR